MSCLVSPTPVHVVNKSHIMWMCYKFFLYPSINGILSSAVAMCRPWCMWMSQGVGVLCVLLCILIHVTQSHYVGLYSLTVSLSVYIDRCMSV